MTSAIRALYSDKHKAHDYRSKMTPLTAKNESDSFRWFENPSYSPFRLSISTKLKDRDIDLSNSNDRAKVCMSQTSNHRYYTTTHDHGFSDKAKYRSKDRYAKDECKSLKYGWRGSILPNYGYGAHRASAGRYRGHCRTTGPTKEQKPFLALACCLGLQEERYCHHDYCLGSVTCNNWLKQYCASNPRNMLDTKVCAQWINDYKQYDTYKSSIKDACKKEILNVGSYANACKDWFIRNRFKTGEMERTVEDLCRVGAMKDDEFCACTGTTRTTTGKTIKKACTQSCLNSPPKATYRIPSENCDFYMCDMGVTVSGSTDWSIGDINQQCTFDKDNEAASDQKKDAPPPASSGQTGKPNAATKPSKADTGSGPKEEHWADSILDTLGLTETFKDFDNQTKSIIIFAVIGAIVFLVIGGSSSGGNPYYPPPMYPIY